MNQFRVECSEVNYFTVLVEAETEDKAKELARANINSFPVDDEYTGEWVIESIKEVWLNYSQKVLFDDWISRCPIEGVFVDEPVSEVQMDDGKVGYLVKVFLTIDKEDWEQNQSPPGI